ncbi:MAG: hypothetical protein KC501_22745, partial [Myxococcales bacterium]|nr:hypothetical protein [Myxococcales bacterium]
MSSGATEAAGAVVQGLRRHGGDWAQTRECALLVVKVLRDGEAHDVLTVTAALRRYRVAQAARRAVARHAPRAQRRALTGRRLTGRELVAALLAWAERGEEAHLRGDRVEVE